MKYDNIIIGGGLSGLVAGIESAKSGRNTAIISAGQSALHFWSGSFEFLCHSDGKDIYESPLKAAENLDANHPYKRIGLKKTREYLEKVAPLLKEAGIKVNGTLDRNHYRLTPFGIVKPAWLTLDDYISIDSLDKLKGKKAAILNIESYLDFYPSYIEHGLRPLGVDCTIGEVDVPQLGILRRSTTEMRATNMSRFLKDDAIDSLAKAINEKSKGADAVIMPAVLGIFSDDPVDRLRAKLERPIFFISTIPASVPGVRCQLSLKKLFIDYGGTFIPGDTVTKGLIEGNRIKKIYTANFGDVPIEADNFVISTGSFFGQGLIATIDRVYEPVFGLDLNVKGGRTEWYDKDVYSSQPYMGFGVEYDEDFHPLKDGKAIENLYATGALLSGFNALKEGSGAGITLASAFNAADHITR